MVRGRRPLPEPVTRGKQGESPFQHGLGGWFNRETEQGGRGVEVVRTLLVLLSGEFVEARAGSVCLVSCLFFFFYTHCCTLKPMFLYAELFVAVCSTHMLLSTFYHTAFTGFTYQKPLPAM